MTPRPLLAASLAIGMMTTACQPAPAPVAATPPDTAAVRAELDQLWGRYAEIVVARDAEGYRTLYTDNGRIDMQGFPPLVGLDQILGLVATAFSENTYQSLVVTPISTAAPDSTLAYQYGTFVETYTPTGKPAQTDYGRYGAGLVRGPDGRWRITYLIGFRDSSTTARP
jgi:hypothetical protein